MMTTKTAWEVAAIAHAGQMYGDMPYIKHLIDVVNILRDNGYDDDYVIVGILHDVLEDTEVTFELLEGWFGLAIVRT